MYPNPQEALPLPSRPGLEQYKKLAKDLVKACRSDDPAAIRVWALHWIDALAAAQGESKAFGNGTEINDLLDRDRVRADPKMLAALTAKFRAD